MKLLFDQNISFRAAKKLAKVFPGCKHISDCGLMDSEDSDIWLYAQKHGYTIVTFDADFYDMSLISGHPPKIIWLRTGNLGTKEIINVLTEKQAQIYGFVTGSLFEEASCLEID